MVFGSLELVFSLSDAPQNHFRRPNVLGDFCLAPKSDSSRGPLILRSACRRRLVSQRRRQLRERDPCYRGIRNQPGFACSQSSTAAS